MEVKKGEIIINGKVLNNLDKFVLPLAKILEKHARYVIVSGYVSIFFGRSRATEDIDVLLEKKNIKKFLEEIENRGYWVVNAGNAKEAIGIIESGSPIRIARKNRIIPNLEVKFARTDVDKITLKNRIKVKFNGNNLYFSPIELQIAYKIFLGSDKDLEDARHLYNIFLEKMDIKKLEFFSKNLGVDKRLCFLWR